MSRWMWPLAAVLVSLVRAEPPSSDALTFRRWVYHVQHPPACDRVPRFVHWDGKPSGLGSQLASLVESLLLALQVGAVFSTEGFRMRYANPLLCAPQSLECYFLPLSGCALAERGQAARVNVTHTACFEDRFDAEALGRRAGLRRAHSSVWFRAQIARYVMRPAAPLARHVAALEARLGLNESGAYAYAAAVHVRHGDKREGRRHAVGEYARQLAFLYHWQHLDTVVLGSDDLGAFRELPAELARMGVVARLLHVPLEQFISPVRRGKYKPVAALLRGDGRPNGRALNASERAAFEFYRSEPRYARYDEGLSLLAQLALMVRCRWFLGTFSSNYARLAYALRYARDPDRAHFHDLDGESYYGCSWKWRFPIGAGGQRRPPAAMLGYRVSSNVTNPRSLRKHAARLRSAQLQLARAHAATAAGTQSGGASSPAATRATPPDADVRALASRR